MFHTDQKCAESSRYWQFFYYRPPGKFRCTAGEITKLWCKKCTYSNIYSYNIYIEREIDRYDLLEIRYGFTYQFNLRVLAQLFTVSFQCLKKMFFQKLPGLWLVGEVINHVGIYESKATEGLSAFQRRFFFLYMNGQITLWKIIKITAIIFKQRWVSLTCKPLKMIHTLDLQDSVVLNRIFLFVV